jgi:hypothetical protein
MISGKGVDNFCSSNAMCSSNSNSNKCIINLLPTITKSKNIIFIEFYQ